MNETNLPDSATIVTWPADDLRMRLPEEPMLPDGTPAVQHLGERVSAVEDALRVKAAQLARDGGRVG